MENCIMRAAVTHSLTIGLFCAFVCAAVPQAAAEMPLETSPAWESSPLGHFGTGGAWADIDRDGWLDLVVANGNDMSRQQLVVYHNNGDGTFPTEPSWRADDLDYHGHLDVGDIDGDGWPDVAVAVFLGPAGFGDPGHVKVYRNDGAGALAATPSWSSAESFFCFSVALGDADGDGDLDLACACGEDYEDHPEPQRIFFNHGGTLEATASWRSDEIDYALDVFWGDVEGDGDQDLLFCGSSTPMRVYQNLQTAGGGIGTQACWESADLPQYGNTTAFGDWNGDGLPEVAVADNNQLGGDGRFKVYANEAGVLATTPAWESSDGGYGSHVSWIDLDLDGDNDLATGRWWGAARIYANEGGLLGTDPDWQSTTVSVIENIFWGDVDNDALREDGYLIASGDGLRTHFPLDQAPVRRILAVSVNGMPIPETGYTAHPGNGWISFASPPPPGEENILIQFRYSRDLDAGVTNWDPQIGNYLFRNTSASGDVPPAHDGVLALRLAPNPMRGSTLISYRGAAGAASLTICDATGRRVRHLHEGALPGRRVSWAWDGRDQRGRRVAAGVYFVRFSSPQGIESRRLIVTAP
ncbi:MAG: T9SS type A sorting domain-containing protein [Candidatus Eisenbacteria bacterium]|nr:T9SS type A sorting domain-containing protein [Candidatus Eisenbacteria bacterium]